MKTDEKLYVKIKRFFIGIISFGALAGIFCSIFYDTKASSGGLGLCLVFGVMWYVFHKEYRRHQELMKQHCNESVQTIVNWLQQASLRDKSSYLDFLTDESLKEIADELEVRLVAYPEEEFQELYDEIQELYVEVKQRM